MSQLGQKYNQGIVIQRSEDGSAFQEVVDVDIDSTETSLESNLPSGIKKVNISAVGGSEVEANPELEGDEDALTGIEIDGTKYKIPEDTGTEVEANPELEGDEDALTGIEIGGVKYKVPEDTGSEVVANPTLAGTEAELTGIEIDGTKYKAASGTNVVANPTLAGSEANLTALQVGNTKYKVPAGGGAQASLYLHYYQYLGGGDNITWSILSNSQDPITRNDFFDYFLQFQQDNIPYHADDDGGQIIESVDRYYGGVTGFVSSIEMCPAYGICSAIWTDQYEDERKMVGIIYKDPTEDDITTTAMDIDAFLGNCQVTRIRII